MDFFNFNLTRNHDVASDTLRTLLRGRAESWNFVEDTVGDSSKKPMGTLKHSSAHYYIAVAMLFALPMYIKCTANSEVTSFRELLRRLLLKVLRKTIMKGSATADLRRLLHDIPLPDVRPRNNHTHATAAAVRSAAVNFMTTFASMAGREMLCYNGSTADLRAGRTSFVQHYWVKDEDKPIIDNVPVISGDHLVTMVDVDYYVDMQTVLARNRTNPYLLYTFVPSAASGQEEDYTYYFLPNGKVKFEVAGGGDYQHELWNYNCDSLIARETLCGLLLRSTHYYVERRNVDADHQLILLVPSSHYPNPILAKAAELVYQGSVLERLKVIAGEFVRIRIKDGEGTRVSTGVVGAPGSVTISEDADTYISQYAKCLKVPLTNASVRTLGDEASKLGFGEASILTAYHRDKVVFNPPVVYPVDIASIGFQVGTNRLTDEDKPLMTAITAPWLHKGFSPYNTPENEVAGFEGRVSKVRSNAQTTPFLTRCMHEFAELLFPVPNILNPVAMEDVYDNQSRPSQRRILDQADIGVKGSKNVFMKAEAYQKPNDPRIITQMGPLHKAEYSQYIYALSEHLKTTDWYAFGRTPVDIALRVTEICATEEEVFMTDFSRFDGHVSPALRHLEAIVLARGFQTRYRDDLLSHHRDGQGGRLYGRYGNEFVGATERCSGSPETSSLNTIDVAFSAYLAMRMTQDSREVFITPHVAYANLGMYGGDDGISRFTTKTNLEKAARQLGQELKVDRVTRGQAGVKFLARFYGPHVWTGDPTSMCDIARQLAKLHLTVGLADPRVKLKEKAMGLELTDGETPFIGAWAKAVLAATRDVRFGDKSDMSWFAKTYSKDVQFPNAGGSEWMWDVCEAFWPELDLAGGEEYVTYGDVFMPILLAEPEPPVVTQTMVVQGEIVEPVQQVPKDEEPKEKKKGTKRGKRGGKRKRQGGRPAARMATA